MGPIVPIVDRVPAWHPANGLPEFTAGRGCLQNAPLEEKNPDWRDLYKEIVLKPGCPLNINP
jgi:hypothetical protein